jgi:hypothetical protein
MLTEQQGWTLSAEPELHNVTAPAPPKCYGSGYATLILLSFLKI